MMIRLATSLVTIGSLSLPVLIYQEEYRKGQDRARWKDHTYEAIQLAEQLARDTLEAAPAATLGRDLDAFAAHTSDNPTQVANSGWMRRALDAGDLGRLKQLAKDAIAEEKRLLPVRHDEASRKADRVQNRATIMWAGGVLAAVIQALQAWVGRRDRA
jgi:hypothetical protein